MKHFSALNHSMSSPSFIYFVLYFNLRLRENIVYAVNFLSKSKVDFIVQVFTSPFIPYKCSLLKVEFIRLTPSLMTCCFNILVLSITIGFFPKSKKMTLNFPNEVISLKKIKMKTRNQFHCTFYSACNMRLL